MMPRRLLRRGDPRRPRWLTALVALAVLWPVLLLVAFGVYSATELIRWGLHLSPSPLATVAKLFDSAWGDTLISVALESTLGLWLIAFVAGALWKRGRGGKTPPRLP